MSSVVHVAVGVIVKNGHILIAKRPAHLHQGGKWEFPGGKVDAGESVHSALIRELQEELNITSTAFEPLIQIHHQYPDKSVFLDVHKITEFEGEPRGNEGQEIRWVLPSQLNEYEFPAANQPIVTAANLPSRYVITGEYSDEADLFIRLESVLSGGAKLIQWRAKRLDKTSYLLLANKIAILCEKYNACLQLNCEPAWYLECRWPEFVGLHLTSQQLNSLTNRPAGVTHWLSASCHTSAEIQKAQEVGVDFIVLSSVLVTASHPEVMPLGWETFESMARIAKLPVFALGGLQQSDTAKAIDSGAQGIAGISCFWR